MAVEAADYIKQLNQASPDTNDPRNEGDDHIKLIKKVLLNTFPNLNGAVTRTAEQINKAPYNKDTLAELLGPGVKLPTIQAFSDAQSVDMTFGWDNVAKRIRPVIGGALVLSNLATMDDVGSVNGEHTVINFGGKIKLFRHTNRYSTGTLNTINFPEEFELIPFLILPVSHFNYDAAGQFYGIPNLHSTGTPAYVNSRSLTSCQIQIASSPAGFVTVSTYILGKVK